MTLNPGSKLGPYEIVAPLGAGGMGEVYRAHDSRLGRDVAVKVLPQHLTENPEVRARFEREARTVSSLNHPHICTLHDIGREGDTDYLVMELVEGGTLAERLANGPLPGELVLKFGAQIADALDKAHRAGIVHRDLKPGNIMLAKNGAKLMDFGLARATLLAGGPGSSSGSGGRGVSLAGLTASPTIAQPLTAQGSIVGTFQYMAPEQLEGSEADVRSDVWALGCVLYEMATGRRAFSGGTQASLISAIMKDQPQPIPEWPADAGVPSGASAGLERLVRACLEKDPHERIQTAHDVRLHLRWISEGGSQAGVPAPVTARRRNRERLAWMLVAGTGLAAVALAVLHFASPAPALPTLRFEIPAPSSIQIPGSPRISPDGRVLAYDGTDSTGVTRLYIRPLGSLTAQPLPGTEGTRRPFWSPDSRFLAFMAGGKLKKINVAGGPPTVVCDAPTGFDGAWGRTGVILFDGAGPDPIYRVPASGGVPTTAVRVDSVSKTLQVGWPEFLPDGKHFLYLSILPQPTLRVGSLGSDKFTELGPCESQVEFVPPGYLLYSRGGSLVVQRFDTRALKFTGEPVPVAEQVGANAVGGADFRASQTGVLVFASRQVEAGELVERDRAGKRLRVLSTPSGSAVPALSPDGRRVAVRAVDPQLRTRDVWLVDRTREITSRFTFETSSETSPVWSPDGKRIAYWSSAPGAAGITTKELTGSGETKLLWKSDDEVGIRSWAQDGSALFFDLIGAKGADIWVLPLSGDGKPQPFLNAPFDEYQPRISPDGRLLAYGSNESGREEVYVQTYPDRSDKWQVSTKGGDDPHWSEDGQEIVYLSADQQMMSVPVRTKPSFDPGVPRALFPVRVQIPGQQRAHYDVTRDGKTFVVFEPITSRTVGGTTVIVNWLGELNSH